jgi:hypothetical protein
MAGPGPAWRLIGVHRGEPGVARRLDMPLVGRREQLDRLHTAFDEAVAARRCRFVTVLGRVPSTTTGCLSKHPAIGRQLPTRAAAKACAGRGLIIPRLSEGYKTARYFSISHSVSCTRYSSHSFRFSST